MPLFFGHEPRRIDLRPAAARAGTSHVERATAEASPSHAGISFFSASAGWVPFDPTGFRTVDERHVVVGHGSHHDDVPPSKGIFRGNAREAMRAEVLTRRSALKAIATLTRRSRTSTCPSTRRFPAQRQQQSG